MVNRYIAEYMTSSRRLIIPGIGALVRRGESGEIVFVEMFKQNDGVLTNLISQKMDISTEQADILIERFITELQHDLRYYGYYTIPALGTLRQGEKSISFEANAPAAHKPSNQPSVKAEDKPAEPIVKAETTPSQPAEQMEEKPAEQKEEKPVEQTIKAEPAPAEERVERSAEPIAQPEVKAKAAEERAQSVTDKLKFKIYTKEDDIRQKSAASAPKPAQQRAAQPGKARPAAPKSEQERFRFEAHPDTKGNEPQHLRIRTNRKRKKMDPVTLLAIIAAAIAIVVIIYGLVSSPGPVLDEPLLPVEPDTATVELVTPIEAEQE